MWGTVQEGRERQAPPPYLLRTGGTALARIEGDASLRNHANIVIANRVSAVPYCEGPQ
jgi:hypothetical protein